MSSSRVSLAVREQLAIGGAGLVLLGLLIGVIKLQVFDHQAMLSASESNRIRVVPITARRGLLLDSEHRVIVGNRPSYTLSVIPSEIKADTTIPNLAELLQTDTQAVRSRLRPSKVNNYQPAPIRQDIEFSTIAVLEEQTERFPGVSYELDRVREYTPSLLTESFTGYVDEVSEKELARLDPSLYRMGVMIGKKGLEKEYDILLRGIEGTAFIEVNASGELLGPFGGRSKVQSTPGSDLTLTIDLDLQQVCAEVLREYCCGAIVALDPRSGAVLAMASYPSYDANIFSSFVPDSLWKSLNSDSSHPLVNRPINGLYPPGSTVKLVTVGAGLELGLITPGTTFGGCGGGMQFGNRYFRCWEEQGHGVLAAVGALEQSCDVYMYQLGLRIGVDRLGEYYKQCGFGTRTGVDLPNESSGLVPTSEWYDKQYGKGSWTKTLVLNTSIGQGELLVTPLQLAQFFCGVANGGNVYRPHFVKQSVDDRLRVSVTKPELAFRLPFSPSTISLLMESARAVVEGPAGTAKRLRNKYYTIGGKTGTAQNPHGNEHSLFVAVAPLEAPEIVVCAIVENAGHGSEVAAPAAGKVVERYMFKKLGIEPVVTMSAADSLKDSSTVLPNAQL